MSELILGDGFDYSVKEIMLNFPETPNIFLGVKKGIASCIINSSNQLELYNEFLLGSGMFFYFFYDGYYIYGFEQEVAYGTYVFECNININVETIIPGYAKSYGKHHNILFITNGYAGYSLYETPFTNIIEDVVEYDNSFELKQNYPNPFNPSTMISFELNTENTSLCNASAWQAEDAEIVIYNIKGQKVKTLCAFPNGSLGTRCVVWDGTDQTSKTVGSGIYFYQLKVDGQTKASKKMLLIK